MKKTIAILLILVIGMVGVFANSQGSADLLLKTTVLPIDAMAIVKHGADAPSFTSINGDETDFTSFTTDLATAVALDISNTSTKQSVGDLYTFSNRRLYQVKIVATALSSLVEGGITAYMNYEVSGGNSTAASTPFITNGASTSTTEIVFYDHNAATVSGAAIGANAETIEVKLNTSHLDVPSGTYTGTITFNYVVI